MAMETITLRFRNRRGFLLAADLLLPIGSGPFPAVIFAHNLLGSKESPGDRLIAGMLAREGIAAMLLDFTGHGRSEGTVEESTVAQQVEDLGAALDELERKAAIAIERVGANGTGTGALAVALRAERDPRLRALALRGPRQGALDAIRRVAVPTLIVVGDEDRSILEQALALQEVLAGDKRVAVSVGMEYPTEDPARVREVAVLSTEWFTTHLLP